MISFCMKELSVMLEIRFQHVRVKIKCARHHTHFKLYRHAIKHMPYIMKISCKRAVFHISRWKRFHNLDIIKKLGKENTAFNFIVHFISVKSLVSALKQIKNKLPMVENSIKIIHYLNFFSDVPVSQFFPFS